MSEDENRPSIQLNDNAPSAGSWSDGISGTSRYLDKWQKEEAEAVIQKDQLIQDALHSGLIPPQYADLLQRISSSTAGGKDGASLTKVRAALEIHNQLEQGSFGRGRVAYIASGLDYEFPVALGARTIDMVDLAFSEDGSGNARRELLEKIESQDPDVKVEEDGTITFEIDVGKGPELVTLNLVGGLADDYVPQGPLQGVIEFNGPHGRNIELVREKMLPHITKGAQILNFDFRKNDFQPDGAQSTTLSRGTLYQIENPSSFGNALRSIPRVPEFDLESVRRQVRANKPNNS